MEKTFIRSNFKKVGYTLSFKTEIKGISIDTRNLLPGELFFALKGEQTDGHQYLLDAEKKGACAAVIEERALEESLRKKLQIPLIEVEDVLRTMQMLSQEEIKRRKKTVIAVTGSFGKTTTKDFLKTLLQERFNVGASQGNFNGQIGLCLNILREERNIDLWLLEMAMSEKGHIQRLVEIAPPDFALITNIDIAHGAFFQHLSEIAAAKSEIFSHPNTKIGVLNKEAKNHEIALKSGSCQKILFSLKDPTADFYLKQNEKGFTIFEKGSAVFEGELPVAGSFNQQNFLAAAATARSFGLEWSDIRRATSKLLLPEKRFECYQMGHVLIINDCYNASPAAFEKIVEEVPQDRPGKKIGVFGQMLELGKFSEPAHRSLAKKALAYFDLLLCYGQECRYIVDEWEKAGKTAYLFDQHEALANHLNTCLKDSSLVLFKGSRGCQLEKVIQRMKP